MTKEPARILLDRALAALSETDWEGDVVLDGNPETQDETNPHTLAGMRQTLVTANDALLKKDASLGGYPAAEATPGAAYSLIGDTPGEQWANALNILEVVIRCNAQSLHDEADKLAGYLSLYERDPGHVSELAEIQGTVNDAWENVDKTLEDMRAEFEPLFAAMDKAKHEVRTETASPIPLDPRGHIVLDTRGGGYRDGTMALVLMPENRVTPYVIADGYDMGTGDWAQGYYHQTLSGAVKAMHADDTPDYGKDDIGVDLTVSHETILAAAKAAWGKDIGGTTPSDEEMEQLLEDPKVKSDIGWHIDRVERSVTSSASRAYANLSSSLNGRLNDAVYRSLSKHLDGIAGALGDAQDRLLGLTAAPIDTAAAQTVNQAAGDTEWNQGSPDITTGCVHAQRATRRGR